ncbi:MAG: hypothetical protein U0T02_06435 [Solirubrobacteraceae bacterium]
MLLFALTGMAACTPSAAYAGDIALTISPDPTQEKVVSVTASGTANAAGQLRLYYDPGPQGAGGATGCHRSSLDAVDLALTNVGLGSFSVQRDFTPSASGTYYACAELSPNGYDIEASAAVAISVRSPRASVASLVDGELHGDLPAGVTVAGGVEVARRLHVWAIGNRATDRQPPCPARSSAASLWNLGGDTQRLTAEAGTPIGPGPYTFHGTFTPQLVGSYALCSYVERNDALLPDGASSTTVDVAPSRATVSVIPTQNRGEGEPISFRLVGWTEAARHLRVRWSLDTEEADLVLPPGSFDRTLRFVPARATAYSIYASILDESIVRYGSSRLFPVSARASARIVSCCAPVRPRSLAPKAAQRVPYGRRTVFRWTASQGDDRLELYATQPRDGTKPIWTGEPRAGSFTLATKRVLSPGRYWWVVTRANGDWAPVRSEPTGFTVSPPRLRHLSVRPALSGFKAGHLSLRIGTDPFVNIRVVVRHGRGAVVRRFTTRPRAVARTFRYRWRCQQPGRYAYSVAASDAYGAGRVARGSWVVFSCVQDDRLARARRRLARYRQLARDRAYRRRCAARGGTITYTLGVPRCVIYVVPVVPIEIQA